MLLALFLSFSLTGCNWQGTANNGGSEPSGFSVSFYDENLTLLEKYDNLPNGHEVDFASNSTFYNVSDWYLSNNSTSVTSHNLTSDINFYAVPNVIEITNQTELDNIRTNLGGKYILLNDIDLNETADGFDASYGWNPIGDNTAKFTGIFNGNDNTISNLWINRTSTNYVGLFGYIDNAQIKNLTVEAAEVKGNYRVGAIAGLITSSSITDSYSAGTISGTNQVGGIAGRIGDSSSLTNSYSTANVNGDYYIGGIVGTVVGSSSLTNSYSTANVSGNYYVGGIVGTVVGSSSLTNSYSTGTISGNYYVGGIAGSVESSSSVTNSYAAGTISGISNQVGGITGYVYASNIANNAAINPSVTGTTNVNRITGDINNGAVTNNFALESMTDGTKTLNEGGFTNGSSGNAGTSKTQTELKTPTTYSDTVNGDGLGGLGWDFDNIWDIDEGISCPYLYWQD